MGAIVLWTYATFHGNHHIVALREDCKPSSESFQADAFMLLGLGKEL